jgi:ribulose-5-phosphate 4-epimerase/fuculose-1-phosphate aldolase
MSRLYAKDFVERGPLSVEEARIDCAAGHRLIAHFKLDDLIYSHITMRVPGTADQFFLAPHGLWFDEVTASSLKIVNFAGELIDEGSHPELPHSPFCASFHAPILKARPDLVATMHMHTQAGVAVSMLECGLLTTNHTAMHFHGGIAYHDYEGDFIRSDDFAGGIKRIPDEGARAAELLGDRNIMILRNHGLFTAGATMAACFNEMYYLEFLCRVQIDALATGEKIIQPPAELLDYMGEKYRRRDAPISGYEWPAMLRLLDRIDPSYRD